jgi:hypothetical protein
MHKKSHLGQKNLANFMIAPPKSNLFGANWTWCYVIMTQCHQPTTPGAETIRTESSIHEQIDGMVSAPGRVG